MESHTFIDMNFENSCCKCQVSMLGMWNATDTLVCCEQEQKAKVMERFTKKPSAYSHLFKS